MTTLVSANYRDAILSYYALDYLDAVREIEELQSQGISIKYVDWTENRVDTYTRGVYGETYG